MTNSYFDHGPQKGVPTIFLLLIIVPCDMSLRGSAHCQHIRLYITTEKKLVTLGYRSFFKTIFANRETVLVYTIVRILPN